MEACLYADRKVGHTHIYLHVHLYTLHSGTYKAGRDLPIARLHVQWYIAATHKSTRNGPHLEEKAGSFPTNLVINSHPKKSNLHITVQSPTVCTGDFNTNVKSKKPTAFLICCDHYLQIFYKYRPTGTEGKISDGWNSLNWWQIEGGSKFLA